MALTLDSLKPIFPKYDYKYTERPKAACSTYLSDRNPFNLPQASEYQIEDVPRMSLSSSTPAPLPPSASNYDGQLLTSNTIDCKGKSRGLFFHHHPQGNVNVICVKLSEDCKSPVPVICRERTKTRCTQTRYRESSAQTRPYLPELANDKENYETNEVYQISQLLDSYQPPGEYEAKVVERTRRRRQYEKALKLLNNKYKEKHQSVVEALEWEDWVAREEYIQDCQMLRMQIVEKMFENREKNLRQMSEQRISFSTERIQAKRFGQLRKIQIEYDREMRRLEAKKLKINRNYRKGNIIQEHIDPASDLHAPQMRFGVNPNRRHFVGFRKNFDDRIDELDRQRDVGRVSSLACPFRKLKTWAKPKERMKEVTQRFCSDENLKNMYDSLKGLRMKSEAPKRAPKCLRKKATSFKPEEVFKCEELIEEQRSITSFIAQPLDESIKTDIHDDREFVEEQEPPTDQQVHEKIQIKSDDEIAGILGEFEGTTLGNLLQFLSDELGRLKLQKKFQAIHLLAKKERWWREAAEAGQRQKENKQREEQEELFAKAYETRQDTSSLFLESVLEREFNFTHQTLARDKITQLAEEVPEFDQDELDLEIILSKGKDRQAYDRMVISDCVRNQVFAVAEERFAKMKVEKLHATHLRAIEEELYASVEKALADEFQVPEGICIVGEILDELIDNAVTYDFDIFTPSSSSLESAFDTQQEVNDIISKLLQLVTQKSDEECNFFDLTAEKEAKALIRKLIRKTIPQKRWKDESERIVEQTLSDTFNEAVYELECLKASQQVRADDRLNEVISEIYNRLEECWGKNNEHKTQGETSASDISGFLKSVPSNIDIFENSSANTVSSGESPDDRMINEEINLMKKIEYIDAKNLEKYEPIEICRCHERFNLLEKTSKSWKSLSSLENEFSDKPITSTSSEENLSFSSHYKDLISEPFSRAVYPDLPVEFQDDEDRVKLMTEGSYERASACIERASIYQEKPRCSCYRSRDGLRRSSF
ncbi:cilia- and flagella-associated protein 91-like [Episyrphus balteatus]|uniref:cilia- and flagella-associated protein 91-like n=1 Tax=Episyrphus balteatus TaxID=286459 RepID=UPI002485BF89|nr:cilia- and flagella-associated protein 91-like [Episyrphus balteatus]